MSESSDKRGNAMRVYRLDPAWPVSPGRRYAGLVWNHPTLKDGTSITTSPVVEELDGRIVTRSGSVYLLGRTYESEKHAAEQAGLGLNVARGGAPSRLQVIDLESDDLSVLDTHPNSLPPRSEA